ncbi:MAG: squalene--hopene cyclase [Gammaproteobacteria bacterium]|nr:squalene--hopene cyclase [Gammaproteobacteria bacterium]
MAVRAETLARQNRSLDRAIEAATAWLDQEQTAEGYWVGMLESNCCMEAEWLLAMHYLGFEHPRVREIIDTILNAQRDDGSWEIYHQAPQGDINTTVECYAALKAHGYSADHPRLVNARRWILEHGGLSGIRVFTRYWLALIGEWPWEHTPNIPPEVIAMPRWFPFNIYNFASWARATLVPIAVLSARRAVRALPKRQRLDELFPNGRDAMDYRLPRRTRLFSWQRLFLFLDRCLHGYQRMGVANIGRQTAIAQCLEWVVRHQDADGAWGGIQPPWIYSLLALNTEGYTLEHPVMAKGLQALDSHWSYERDGSLHIQASESPVWDTLLALVAMQDCDRPWQPSMDRALEWVLDKQVTTPGDWCRKVPDIMPGGWPFERANLNYPDVDDTAVALILLARLPEEVRGRTRVQNALRLAVAWVMGMQSSNGGWAAFDRDNDRALLTKIPFCDFGEALDPPSADVTAHVLEALALLGYDASHPALARGYRYLRDQQESDGSWFGRWGVNHIYGTAAVLPALKQLGEPMDAPYVLRAADWLVAHQNSDGGWGESCASYMDDSFRGKGVSTASQTAWALMALLAMDSRGYDAPILDGLRYLLRNQQDGTWDEPQYTGAGFPGYGFGQRMDLRDKQTLTRIAQGTELQRGFMINYNLYRHYFPLLALGRARERFRPLTSAEDLG